MSEQSPIVAPLARIVSRYVSGALLAIGVTVDDGQLFIAASVVVAAVVEGIYAMARRKGWAT